MAKPTIIKTFRDKYLLLGPVMWMLSVQYFVIQIIVARDWSLHYSIAHNTISDLGNTVCGEYGNRYVCSPLHSLMNASFIILGVFMATGSMLMYQEFKKKMSSYIGFNFMAFAGLGTIIVGLFPENTIGFLHTTGAFLPFLIGNLAIVILGFSLKVPRWLKIYSVITGVVALIALLHFITQVYLGLGIGGMERIVAYPQTVWLIVFGIYISKNHFQKETKKI
jgi:hypothetical membrane protein